MNDKNKGWRASEPEPEVYAQEAEGEPLAILNTYLVSEVSKASREVDRGAPMSHFSAMGGVPQEPQESPLRMLQGGGWVVAAVDPDEAVKTVMAETERIGAYMVVQVDLVDFKVNMQNQRAARGRMLRLNDGT